MPSKHRRPAEKGCSKVQAFSVREFFARFPDDATCLEPILFTL